MKKEHPTFESSMDKLRNQIPKIRSLLQKAGLSFPAIDFQVVSKEYLLQTAAYLVPGRIGFWKHGSDYEQLVNELDSGGGRIFECMFNGANPIGLLFEDNTLIENYLVSAHGMVHADFFANNDSFRRTRKDMLEVIPYFTGIIEKYKKEYGELAVEQALEDAYSFWMFIDLEKRQRPHPEEQIQLWLSQYNNSLDSMSFPFVPDGDLMGFLIDFSPKMTMLERNIFAMVREMAYYFRVQTETKIMNESWAALWHKRIMHILSSELGFTATEEREWQFLNTKGTVITQERFSPYAFLAVFEYLEDYYNGTLLPGEAEWIANNEISLPPLNKGRSSLSPGRQMILKVRSETKNDREFISKYLDYNIIRRMGLKDVKEGDWQRYKSSLLQMLDYYPNILVTEGDHLDKHELVIHHVDNVELDRKHLELALEKLVRLWGARVHFQTVVDEERVTFLADGNKVLKRKTSSP